MRGHWALTTMTIAWSVTEIIRYLYYGLNIAKIQPAWLLWCRYTFFFALYPLGAGSEAVLVYMSLPYFLEFDKFDIYYYVRIGVLLFYPPGKWESTIGWSLYLSSMWCGCWPLYSMIGFYMMYTHMIHQRKTYLSKRKIHWLQMYFAVLVNKYR